LQDREGERQNGNQGEHQGSEGRGQSCQEKRREQDQDDQHDKNDKRADLRLHEGRKQEQSGVQIRCVGLRACGKTIKHHDCCPALRLHEGRECEQGGVQNLSHNQ